MALLVLTVGVLTKPVRALGIVVVSLGILVSIWLAFWRYHLA